LSREEEEKEISKLSQVRPSKGARFETPPRRFISALLCAGERKALPLPFELTNNYRHFVKMTTHPSPRAYYSLKSNRQQRGGRRLRKDDEKRESIGTKVAPARTIEISSGWRIDIGKAISSVRNNCYYSQVDDDDSAEIAATERPGRRRRRRRRRREAEFWEIERRRGPRRLGPTMMDEESFREEEW
jgi:hypothetical protein